MDLLGQQCWFLFSNFFSGLCWRTTFQRKQNSLDAGHEERSMEERSLNSFEYLFLLPYEIFFIFLLFVKNLSFQYFRNKGIILNLIFWSSITSMAKAERMRWLEHVTRLEDERTTRWELKGEISGRRRREKDHEGNGCRLWREIKESSSSSFFLFYYS